MSKPIIAYIEEERDTDFNSLGIGNIKREGLSYFLREDCGCEVINYNDKRDFEAGLSTLKRYFSFHQLILIIIKQESSGWEHQELIDLIRQEFSSELPIVIIPVTDKDKRFRKTDNRTIYSFFYEDGKIGRLINKLKVKWLEPLPWLGAETKEDQGLLYGRLEKAYEGHYFDDGMLGVPDHNHMIVAEAVRLKCMPSSHIKAEFDDMIENLSFFNLSPQSSDYLKDINRIKDMSLEEKENFLISLMEIRGYLKSSNGWTVTRASCGSRVNGFAIDPKTSETLITTRPGLHHKAGYFLSLRIDKIEAIRNPGRGYVFNSAMYCERRLITGLIFLKVLDFKTPILLLNHEEGQLRNLQNVMSFIGNQRDFIVLDCDGNLLS